MDDEKIIELYWVRSEAAISETASKYGRYCQYIARNILCNTSDIEECVNDTYLNAWNSMPPHRPSALQVFLGKLTRNISLNRRKYLTAEKRGRGQAEMVLDELHECIPTSDNTESIMDDILLEDVLNHFLSSLSVEQRKIFMRRYWYLSPIKDIAADYNLGESKVKMSLLRSREKLKQILEKEGISL